MGGGGGGGGGQNNLNARSSIDNRRIQMSDHCIIVVTCWERANLLALLCVMFSYVFVTFPCGVLCQVWYLIVSIRDLCTLLTYLDKSMV